MCPEDRNIRPYTIKLLACQKSTRELIAEVSQIANVTLIIILNPSSTRPESCKTSGNTHPGKCKFLNNDG